MVRTSVAFAGAIFSASLALGQTGISADRVSLPEGPGSLEGLGDNISVNANMALMTLPIPIELPSGHADMTPQIALRYNSGGGGSIVGMGWTLDFPCIERMTSRGVPHYDTADLFSADGSTELVEIPGSDPATYRAREEGGFVRYRWQNRGDGSEGYWTAEHPDGRVDYFGADATGALVTSARLSGDRGTFRYHLVETVDVYGHAIRYTYNEYAGNVPLVEQIGYVFEQDGTPRFSVELVYEDRLDHLSDAKAGFDERLRYRLQAVDIYSLSQRLGHYQLSYEDYTSSGGMTRLLRVEQLGVGDVPHPVVFGFSYTQSLGGSCYGDRCQEPYLVHMGSLGVDIASRDATLIDINGDALPDVVDSSEVGDHRFFINQLAADGTHTFAAPVYSAVGTQSSHRLSSRRVQPLDVDGDGFTDLVNTGTAEVLRNLGTGDWVESYSLLALDPSNPNIPDLEVTFDADDDPDLGESVRFMDYDNDRRIDILQALQGQTNIFRNVGGLGFEQVAGVENIGWSFETDQLDLADMNGDGLLDPVLVTATGGSISYRLSFGDGTWGPVVDILGLPIDAAEVPLAQLEDINGDSLADLVVVVASEVKYALNRNGTAFAAITSITEAAGEALPERDATVTVMFADMNGNGSDDVVWIDASGAVTYLELFPVRPNLITRIENGLGMTTEVSYATSVEEQARDVEAGDPWAHNLPHPMVVVKETDTWEALTDVHEVVAYTYHDGYYDGLNKQFRGYGRVEHLLAGDDYQEPGLFVERYELGADDSYRHGLLLESQTYGDGAPLRMQRNTYADCPVAEIPAVGLVHAIRYICKTEEETVHQEGAAETEWVTTQTLFTHDGYGNQILVEDHGVVDIGGGGCGACSGQAGEYGAPCGPSCLGDEAYEETVFVEPASAGGLWILNKSFQHRTYGVAGSDNYTETLVYYDGEPFAGLPLGQLTRGDVSRVTRRLDNDDTVVESRRESHDSHGNVVESIDPNGTIDGQDHRERIEYDDLGLTITGLEIALLDDDSEPYALRKEYRYDSLWNYVSEATEWMRVEGGSVVSARNSHYFARDAFGRLSSIIRPGGDTVESPTQTFTYELGNPVSRVVVRQRSQVGGSVDTEYVQCFDGRGREVQRRTRIAADRYQVSGFVARNSRGEVVRAHQPYEGDSGACETEPPQGVPYTELTYDAAHRTRSTIEPDADLYTTASFKETVYGPMVRWEYDEEDNDPSSSHANTPTTIRVDGLGRVVAIERLYEPGGEAAVTRAIYDEHGNLAAVIDAAGSRKDQRYDLAGRLVAVTDPNAGSVDIVRDAAGNVIERTDARGVVLRMRYDGANRLLQRWEDSDETGTAVHYYYDVTSLCSVASCPNTTGRIAAVTYPLMGLPGAPLGSDLFGYDIRGRQIHQQRTIDGIPFELSWRYDNLDRVIGRTFPDGQTASYEYDQLSRLTSIEGIIDEVAYDARGDIASLEHANGAVDSMSRDVRRRLASLGTSITGATDLQALTYTRDRVGNILDITDAGPSASAGATFTYDAGYRLLTSQIAPGTAEAEGLTTTYDAVDNILSLASDLGATSPGHMGDYSYDAGRPNAAVAAGDETMAYDAAGYMTQRGVQTLTWDHFGRLTGVSEGGNEVQASVYGPDHLRVAKIEGDSVVYYPDRDFEVRDGISAVYARVGRQRVARQRSAALAPTVLSDIAPANGSGDLTSQPDGEITAADAWLAHASENGLVTLTGAPTPSAPGSLLLSSVRRLLMETNGETIHMHANHQESLVAATNAAGEVVGQRRYYPNGKIRGQDDGGVGPYGFTGQELDAGTGLLHFAHRFYDPAVGRWLSVDPAFLTVTAAQLDPEATGAYVYVANNPVNAIDPTGLKGKKMKPGTRHFIKKRTLYRVETRRDRSTGQLTQKTKEVKKYSRKQYAAHMFKKSLFYSFFGIKNTNALKNLMSPKVWRADANYHPKLRRALRVQRVAMVAAGLLTAPIRTLVGSKGVAAAGWLANIAVKRGEKKNFRSHNPTLFNPEI